MLSHSFNNAAHILNVQDNIYWQAARAGQFQKIIDLYIKDDKQLPRDILLSTNGDKTELTLLNFLMFTREENIMDALLRAPLWCRQIATFHQLYKDSFAPTLKEKFNYQDKLIEYFNAFTAQFQKQYGYTKPLTRRKI